MGVTWTGEPENQRVFTRQKVLGYLKEEGIELSGPVFDLTLSPLLPAETEEPTKEE